VNQVGIILGLSLLGRFSVFNNILFSIKGQEILGMLSLMSYMLFNFVNTVKMDVGMIKRTGKKPFFYRCCMHIVAFPNWILSPSETWKILAKERRSRCAFIYNNRALHTPFPVVAWLLEDLDILNSELGRLGLSAALVSDVLSVFLTVTFTLTRI
jgi:Kef-type K+ transport system membrane component KefB